MPDIPEEAPFELPVFMRLGDGEEIEIGTIAAEPGAASPPSLGAFFRAAADVADECAGSPSATVTEWGVKFTDPGKPPHVQRYYNKAEAREARDQVLALDSSLGAALASRTVTTGPWEEVRDA
jgi:hypothetical protein